MPRAQKDSPHRKKVQWRRLYSKYFPWATDPYSRHVKVISEALRAKKSTIRQIMEREGYDPDHWAHSMETAVKMLWDERAKNKAKD